MKKAYIGILALIAFAAATEGAPLNSWRSASEYIQTRADQQQKRIQALARRGKAANYEQLLRNGIPREGFGFPRAAATESLRAKQTRTSFEEVTKREAAINLAALGYKASDVAAYRKRNLDLFGIAHRLFSASATPEEQMLLADTVLVAKAVSDSTSRIRLDGYLSALSFQVVKPLKGSPVTGDIVYLPQRSGVDSDGLIVNVTSDIRTESGKSYLLVLSKDWYEQSVAEKEKQAEVGFNALCFLAYEISDNGTLLAHPRPSLSGAAPQNIRSVEAALKQLPQGRD